VEGFPGGPAMDLKTVSPTQLSVGASPALLVKSSAIETTLAKLAWLQKTIREANAIDLYKFMTPPRNLNSTGIRYLNEYLAQVE
jgi:hypothetical protein